MIAESEYERASSCANSRSSYGVMKLFQMRQQTQGPCRGSSASCTTLHKKNASCGTCGCSLGNITVSPQSARPISEGITGAMVEKCQHAFNSSSVFIGSQERD
eukprot:48548-Eustigmatos_ZCMA.PRE.1